MNLKAILVLCGASLAAAGVIISLGGVTRAIGIDYDRPRPTFQHPDPEGQQVRNPIISDDDFSPDAFRSELL